MCDNPNTLMSFNLSVCLCFSGCTQTLLCVLSVLVELAVELFILISTIILFKLQINWENKTLSSKTSESSSVKCKTDLQKSFLLV